MIDATALSSASTACWAALSRLARRMGSWVSFHSLSASRLPIGDRRLSAMVSARTESKAARTFRASSMRRRSELAAL